MVTLQVGTVSQRMRAWRRSRRTPAVRGRGGAGAAAAKSTPAKNVDKKKQPASAKKATSSKSADKEVDDDDDDNGGDDNDEAEPEDQEAYLCTKNGGAIDGPLNVVLPGAQCERWTSSDFCMLVDNVWRRDKGVTCVCVCVCARVCVCCVCIYVYICICYAPSWDILWVRLSEIIT